MFVSVFDARTATPHFPGIGRYVESLVHAMAGVLAPDEQLFLIESSKYPTGWEGAVDVESSPFSLAQQWKVPWLLRWLKADLYHSAYYLMPYFPGVPTVLTVYDVIPLRFPEHSTARARLLFRLTTKLALHASEHVIAISEATKQDYVHFFGVPLDRITAIPLAASDRFSPRPPEEVEALQRKYGLPDRFFLYLGSNKPHKNLGRLVEAWAKVKPKDVAMVIAGAWISQFPEPKVAAEKLGVPVIWLGPVPEDDLLALYSAAEAFVFPSLYEGFGLPVLEAMACGAPVACSNISSLPEVAGDAALYLDPESVDSISEALRRLLSDAELRVTLRERGLERAGEFSWNRTAERTLEVYRSVL